MGAGREVKLISHRGNISGPNIDRENSPTYIEQAIRLGFDVEMDLRVVKGKPFLGHDNPQYQVSKSFLSDLKRKSWIHCKNDEAIDYCTENDLHYFYHDTDRYTLTSHGYIWGYPGSEPVGKSMFISVLPELTDNLIRKDVCGVCSDYVKGYQNV